MLCICSSTVVQNIATTRYIAVGVAGNSFRNISLNHPGTEAVSFLGLPAMYGNIGDGLPETVMTNSSRT